MVAKHVAHLVASMKRSSRRFHRSDNCTRIRRFIRIDSLSDAIGFDIIRIVRHPGAQHQCQGACHLGVARKSKLVRQADDGQKR